MSRRVNRKLTRRRRRRKKDTNEIDKGIKKKRKRNHRSVTMTRDKEVSVHAVDEREQNRWLCV